MEPCLKHSSGFANAILKTYMLWEPQELNQRFFDQVFSIDNIDITQYPNLIRRNPQDIERKKGELMECLLSRWSRTMSPQNFMLKIQREWWILRNPQNLIDFYKYLYFHKPPPDLPEEVDEFLAENHMVQRADMNKKEFLRNALITILLSSFPLADTPEIISPAPPITPRSLILKPDWHIEGTTPITNGSLIHVGDQAVVVEILNKTHFAFNPDGTITQTPVPQSPRLHPLDYFTNLPLIIKEEDHDHAQRDTEFDVLAIKWVEQMEDLEKEIEKQKLLENLVYGVGAILVILSFGGIYYTKVFRRRDIEQPQPQITQEPENPEEVFEMTNIQDTISGLTAAEPEPATGSSSRRPFLGRTMSEKNLGLREDNIVEGKRIRKKRDLFQPSF